MEQIQDEIMLVLDFLQFIYGLFEFEWELELSTRPEARLGADEVWDKARVLLCCKVRLLADRVAHIEEV